MSWAKFAIEGLQAGKTVQIRPRGHSMKGKVNDGDLVTLEPCVVENLKVDDVVLVRVKGNVYLHLIKAVDGPRFLSVAIAEGRTGGSDPRLCMELLCESRQRQNVKRREERQTQRDRIEADFQTAGTRTA